MDLTLILAGLIALGVILYVILDGFDLGVGILFAVEREAACRDVMVNSIAPVWDGNETWLIFGGALLFAAFPVAYAVALPAFYIPVMAMLFALIFRGVAFEFRAKAKNRRVWDRMFLAGSTLAAFSQGLLLGGLVQGVTIRNGAFAGGPFDWATPLAFAAAFGVLAGYALLGATWLILKAEGVLQARARQWAQVLTVAVLLFMGLVSIITPLRHPAVAERWFVGDNLFYLAPVPVATALVAILLLWSIRSGRERAPFVWTIALFLLGYLGIAISLYPFIVPYDLSIRDAAAPYSSKVFVLVAASLTLPMIFGYTWYAYHVFRGKVRREDAYGAGHHGHDERKRS